MLSSYEIGNTYPSYLSLSAILSALSADFHDLQEALAKVSRNSVSNWPQIGATDSTLLGPALRRLRAERGATQQAVCDLAGIRKSMLSCYETGAQLPSFVNLELVLEAMKYDFHDFQDAMDVVRADSGN